MGREGASRAGQGAGLILSVWEESSQGHGRPPWSTRKGLTHTGMLAWLLDAPCSFLSSGLGWPAASPAWKAPRPCWLTPLTPVASAPGELGVTLEASQTPASLLLASSHAPSPTPAERPWLLMTCFAVSGLAVGPGGQGRVSFLSVLGYLDATA